MQLLPKDILYPAPGVHGGQIALSGADLREFHRDLWAAQPIAKRNKWPFGRLLANRSVEKGEILECCCIEALPTAKWHVSCPGMCGYITVTGRKGHEHFAQHHRGIRWTPLQHTTIAAPQVRFKRSSRRDRTLESTMNTEIFDYGPTPPASPASLVGNHPYGVHLHKWAALALGPTNHPHQGLEGLHCCGRKNCICLAHLQLGTKPENTADRKEHKMRTGRACRPYPAR